METILKVENLTKVFSRKGQPDFTAVNHIGFEMAPGDCLGLIGESGSGKSTMMKLLMSFYRTESGSITVGGKDIADYSHQAVRDRIAYVSQKVFFFSDTIRNNLTMGDTSITDDQIRKACEMAKADSFIETLQSKYDTVLSDKIITVDIAYIAVAVVIYI